MSQQKVTVSLSGETARVEVPRASVQAWKDGTDVSWVGLMPEAAVLLRTAARANGFIAASLSSLSIEELFGYVMSGVRTGRLMWVRGAARKTVSFRDGQVVFATSTEPWERLGSAMVRMNLLSREDLQKALAKVGPGARLGHVLTRAGLLTPARLYGAMAFLVREIVIDLFSLRDGHVLFLEGVPPPVDVLKLPEPTRELALLGVKRSEEVLRLQRRLSPGLVVAQGTGILTGNGQRLYELVGGGMELRRLRPLFEGSEYEFLRLIDELLGSGALVVQPPGEGGAPRETPAFSALPVLERYNAVVLRIAQALKAAGHGLGDLRSFLADPLPGMEEAFREVTLDEEGRLDTAKVMANLDGDHDAAARLRAYEALDAFVSYALFSARNLLPPEVADELTQHARGIQEGLT